MAFTEITTINSVGVNAVSNNPSSNALDITNGNKLAYNSDQILIFENTDGSNDLDVRINLPNATSKGFSGNIDVTIATGNQAILQDITSEYANGGFLEITFNDQSGSSTAGTVKVINYRTAQ